MFSLSTDPSFILGNAQIIDNPVVYSSDGFCKLTGFSRSEVMKKCCDCSFLYGDQTDEVSTTQVRDALIKKHALQLESIFYKKDGEFSGILPVDADST
jgi:PAS domain-containing protein